MSEGESFLGEVAGDIEGVAETGLHAAEGVYDGATGDWDGAADNALSMTEGALGVATGGIFTAAESGLDGILSDNGMPSTHDLINSGAQEVGGMLGDGLESLVGDEHALQSARDFDDGNYLSGVGEMAEGIGETAYNAASSAASSAYDAASDAASGLLQDAESIFE
jgi:hypothetical protein